MLYDIQNRFEIFPVLGTLVGNTRLVVVVVERQILSHRTLMFKIFKIVKTNFSSVCVVFGLKSRIDG